MKQAIPSMPEDFKLFVRYIAPSMIAMIIAGSYSIIDTVFIGQGMGKLGLAAVALTWPLIMLFWGVGDLLGTGAAALISQARGAGNMARAKKIFSNMLLLQFIFFVPMCLIVYPLLKPILSLLGADSEMMPYAYDYSEILILTSAISMFSMASIAVVRNDGRPFLSMWLVVLGLLCNVFLDWLFIIRFHWGAKGAAWATVASQFASAFAAAIYFLSPYTRLKFSLKSIFPDATVCRKIFVTGIPIFGSMFAMISMLYMHNIQSLRYGGVDGLAAYTLVACLESAGSMLLTGLACGVQPLVAYLYGSGEYSRQNKIGNYGYLTAFFLGIALMGFSYALRNDMPSWCGLSGKTAELAAHGVLISSTAFILLGVIRVAAYYYQSTGKILYSSLLIYGDAFVAIPLCLFTMPCFLGMDGVWLAMPASRAILFALLCYIWYFKGHQALRRRKKRSHISC